MVSVLCARRIKDIDGPWIRESGVERGFSLSGVSSGPPNRRMVASDSVQAVPDGHPLAPLSPPALSLKGVDREARGPLGASLRPWPPPEKSHRPQGLSASQTHWGPLILFSGPATSSRTLNRRSPLTILVLVTSSCGFWWFTRFVLQGTQHHLAHSTPKSNSPIQLSSNTVRLACSFTFPLLVGDSGLSLLNFTLSSLSPTSLNVRSVHRKCMSRPSSFILRHLLSSVLQTPSSCYTSHEQTS